MPENEPGVNTQSEAVFTQLMVGRFSTDLFTHTITCSECHIAPLTPRYCPLGIKLRDQLVSAYRNLYTWRDDEG